MSWTNTVFQSGWRMVMSRRTSNVPPQQHRFPLGGSKAGVQVTDDAALKFSAVYRAVVLLSEAVAGLRWEVFDTDNEDRLIKNREHYLRRVLNRRPNTEMPAFQFRRTMTMQVLIYGNAYAEIERDGGGRVIGLWIIDPMRVTAKRDDNGRLFYEVRNGMAAAVPVPAERMFHLRGPSKDGITGLSIVALASESVGLGLAMEQFGATFFGNGTNLNGVLETDAKLNDEGYENLKDSWNEAHRGVANANKVAILEQGLTWKQTSVEPDKAQYTDSRTWIVVDFARWFGIPPHKLGVLSDATFSNVEQQGRDYADDGVKPLTTMWEEEANFKLFAEGDDANRVTRHDLNDLYRADLKAMGEFYGKMLDHGVYNVNEVREKIDENNIGTDGDKRFVTVNVVPLDQAEQKFRRKENVSS